MSKIPVIAIGLACFAFGAIAANWMDSIDDGASVLPVDDSLSGGAPSRALGERVARLEQAIASEREARQILQEELLVLTEALVPDRVGSAPGTDDPVVPATADAVAPAPSLRGRGGRVELDAGTRRDRLIERGFTAGEAEQILRRESEIRMETIEARYEARRTGEPFDPGDAPGLRDELGDDAYERYLDASGRPTSVTVSSVFDRSPAEAAGLRPGDEIRRYDGRRVFSMNEIVELSLEGQVGESVTVDILRDGVPMQLSLPRGPLGVSGGRRFR